MATDELSFIARLIQNPEFMFKFNCAGIISTIISCIGAITSFSNSRKARNFNKYEKYKNSLIVFNSIQENYSKLLSGKDIERGHSYSYDINSGLDKLKKLLGSSDIRKINKLFKKNSPQYKKLISQIDVKILDFSNRTISQDYFNLQESLDQILVYLKTNEEKYKEKVS